MHWNDPYTVTFIALAVVGLGFPVIGLLVSHRSSQRFDRRWGPPRSGEYR